MTMPGWTLLFLVVCVLTGLVGFSKPVTIAAVPARVLFFVAAAMVLVSGALSIFRI